MTTSGGIGAKVSPQGGEEVAAPSLMSGIGERQPASRPLGRPAPGGTRSAAIVVAARMARLGVHGGTRRSGRGRRWRRAWGLLLTAAIVAACGAAPDPPSRPSPSQAPTPAPSVTTTASPTPSPTPTLEPIPTMTADDAKIVGIVKDGAATMLTYANEWGSVTGLDEARALATREQSFADTQLALTSIYAASPCTSEAWDLYAQGMTQMSDGVDDVLAWLDAGAVGDLPSDNVSGSATTLGQAINALPSDGCAATGASSSQATPSAAVSATGYAAVVAELDTPGTLMTDTVSPTWLDPDFFAQLWNLRSVALGVDGFGWTFGKLPKAKPDAAGNPVITVSLSEVLVADAVLVLNPDGSLRSVAVTTPTGGYGGTATYLSTNVLYQLLVETLRPNGNLDVLSTLGLADTESSRAGLDTTVEAGGLRFRFIGTADHGDWLIATAPDAG